MRVFISVCVIAYFGASFARSQAVPGVDAEWGTVSDGLRIAIAERPPHDTLADERAFAVAIENVGDRDVVLNLGYMLANGKAMYPAAVALVITDAQGNTRELRYVDRRSPGVGGRFDDFTVALRSGSVHILRLSLADYASADTREGRPKLAAGPYRIAARVDGKGASFLNLDTPGIGLMNFWKGTLRSNSIEFTVP